MTVSQGMDEHRDVTRLIRFMLANLVVGLVVAALTWTLHDAIVDHQFAATAATDRTSSLRDSLSTTLWSRPAPAVAVTLLYPLFIKRLHQRQRRGYRRVLIVSIAQILSLGYLAVGAHYPWWLRAAEVVQLAFVLTVLWAATRPSVRAEFRTPDRSRVDV